MRLPTALLALALAAPLIAGGAAAQNDTRQAGPAPAVKGAPPATRNPATPHPNCVRDKAGKCQPTAAAKTHAQSR